jgi:hypothetical protein
MKKKYFELYQRNGQIFEWGDISESAVLELHDIKKSLESIGFHCVGKSKIFDWCIIYTPESIDILSDYILRGKKLTDAIPYFRNRKISSIFKNERR